MRKVYETKAVFMTVTFQFSLLFSNYIACLFLSFFTFILLRRLYKLYVKGYKTK